MAKELTIKYLEDQLTQYVCESRFEGSIFDAVQRNKHLMLIHRVRVTPASIYLEGPEPEVGNRVVRNHMEHLDFFARLTFSEEDGDRLEQKFDVDPQQIYSRFLDILNTGIDICGSRYSFLGFSSSSLRSNVKARQSYGWMRWRRF